MNPSFNLEKVWKSEAPHINKESSRSQEHTTSVFTVKSHLHTTQHTATMQMPQYKLAPLLTLQCYIHNIPYQQPLLLVMLLPNDPTPSVYVRPPLLLYHWPHFHQKKGTDMSHCTQMVLFPLNPCYSVNHHTLLSHSYALIIHNKTCRHYDHL